MWRSIGLMAVLAVLVGCPGPMGTDGGVDSGTPFDAGLPDSGVIDAGAPDAGSDAGNDAGVDGGADAGEDAGVDAGTDAGVDAGFDAGPPPPGCRTNAQCASGLCLPSGDCKNCQADTECADGGVCGTGVCNLPCGSGGTTCPGSLTCCGTVCVDTTRDPAHCNGCGLGCTASQFCGRGACVDTTFAGLCAQPVATQLMDGVTEDDLSTLSLGAALVASCTPAVTSREVGQTDAGVLRAADGEPLQLGELLVMGGGSYRQTAVRWLEDQNKAELRDTSTSTNYVYSLPDGGVVSSVVKTGLNSSKDRVLIQLVRAPSGSLVLNAAGFFGTGTLAAADYFVRNILPNRASITKRWYVLEWTDNDFSGGPTTADTYVVIASGP